jgi:hypothetical protein
VISLAESARALEKEFSARGIPFDRPGFYDHPAFLAAERDDPTFVKYYARYVHDRARTPDYDQNVRQVVPIVADVYHQALLQDGRLGACVDMSIILSRALEREGIWNYIVKGSLTTIYPAGGNIESHHYWSIDNGTFAAAHAWVAVPPLFVVDLTLRRQPLQPAEEEHLPPLVCDEASRIVQATLDDVVAPETQSRWTTQGMSPAEQLRARHPNEAEFMGVFPARELQFRDTILRYVPVAAGAPDLPFEDTTCILFSGRRGYEVYAKEVSEALARSRGQAPKGPR